MPTGERNTAKTHCPQGHPYAGDNLYVYVGKNGKRSRHCRECLRERRRRDRTDRSDYFKEWERRPEVRRKRRDQHLRRKFGITVEEETALREKQDGRCAGCGAEARLVVDHCHETGVVRGLLCDPCNRAAGCVNDDPRRLRALAEYLDR